MKHLMIALAAAAATVTAAPAFAAEAAPAAAPAAAAFTTADTPIGDLLDNPAAKAVLARHIPEMIENAQIDMARTMTLKQIQGFAGDALSDEKLAKIDAELAALNK